MRKPPHDYTNEQIEFLRTNRNVRRDELHKMFNEKFETDINKGALCNYMVRNRILSDSNGQFKKGGLPWNTGKSGYMGANKTSFKPGNRPHTWLPVGTERVNPEGYLEIKIAEPDKWKTKHSLVWEQHHKRKPPTGCMIIFLDGNKQNLDINNLELITRAVNGRLSKSGHHKLPPDIKRVAINTHRLEQKVKQLTE